MLLSRSFETSRGKKRSRGQGVADANPDTIHLSDECNDDALPKTSEYLYFKRFKESNGVALGCGSMRKDAPRAIEASPAAENRKPSIISGINSNLQRLVSPNKTILNQTPNHSFDFVTSRNSGSKSAGDIFSEKRTKLRQWAAKTMRTDDAEISSDGSDFIALLFKRLYPMKEIDEFLRNEPKDSQTNRDSPPKPINLHCRYVNHLKRGLHHPSFLHPSGPDYRWLNEETPQPYSSELGLELCSREHHFLPNSTDLLSKDPLELDFRALPDEDGWFLSKFSFDAMINHEGFENSMGIPSEEPLELDFRSLPDEDRLFSNTLSLNSEEYSRYLDCADAKMSLSSEIMNDNDETGMVLMIPNQEFGFEDRQKTATDASFISSFPLEFPVSFTRYSFGEPSSWAIMAANVNLCAWTPKTDVFRKEPTSSFEYFRCFDGLNSLSFDWDKKVSFC